MREKNRLNGGYIGQPRYNFRELPKRFALLPLWYTFDDRERKLRLRVALDVMAEYEIL